MVKIADPEQFEEVKNYFEEKSLAEKKERAEKRKKVKEYMALGIEKTLAQDMVRFGL